ncbi:ferrous iron transport protein A [Hymenobacter sp. BRD67]|uniref:FeoA family protein n=1 Tax=Hymenobacter sp. BRD67 TaxID=2675877 RepID=UPI0020B7E52C|nr:FeoA family protein [Hymenobacter sp. BRD67]
MALFRRSTAVAAQQPASGRRTANDLRPGESATVCCLKDPQMALKLLDMGCIPGTQVRLAGRAPLGDPLMLVLGDEEYTLSLRVSEALTIQLKD